MAQSAEEFLADTGSKKPSAEEFLRPSEPSFFENVWQKVMGSRDKPTMFGSAAQGAGQAVGDVGYGLAQLGVHMAPPVGGQPQAAQAMDRMVRQREAAYQASPAVRQHPIAAGVGRIGGDIATSAPMGLGPLSRAAGAGASIPARIGAGAVAGAAGALPNPVASGDYWAGKRAQLGMGAAGGATMPAVGGALAPRLMAPQNIGRAFPWVRNFLSGAEERTVDGFDRTVARQVLDPIAGTVPSKLSGHELVRHTAETIDKAYDRVLPGINVNRTSFMRDNPDLKQIVSELSDEDSRRYTKILENRVLSKFDDATGAMDGQTFKRVQSDLGNRASSFLGTNNDDLGRALFTTLRHLNQTAVIDSPAVAADLTKVNESFMLYARMRQAAGGATSEGKFSPTDLLRAVRSQDPTSGREAFATGDAALQKYGEMGYAALGQRRPPWELMDLFTRHGALAAAARGTIPPTGRGMKAATPYAAPVIGREADEEMKFVPGSRP